jgi:hypothetical protein
VDRGEPGSADWDQAIYWQLHADGSGSTPPTRPEPEAQPARSAPEARPTGPVENPASPPRGGRANLITARVVVVFIGVLVVAVIVANSLGQGATNGRPRSSLPLPVTTSEAANASDQSSLSADPNAPSASPAVSSPTPVAPSPSNGPKPLPAPKPVSPTAHPMQTVLLVSRASGKAMRVSDAATYDGATIVQARISGSNDQLWRLVDAGSGFVAIVNVNSGKALDSLGSPNDGSGIKQSTPLAGNHNQQWKLTSVGGGFSIITNRTSGRVLDLRDGGFDDTTIIQQWTAFPDDRNQQWLVAAPA